MQISNTLKRLTAGIMISGSIIYSGTVMAADTIKVFVFVAGIRKAHPLLQRRPASAAPMSCPGAMSCM